MARDDCDSCCGILQLASNNETFKWAVLNSLCTIATNVADGLQAVTTCLEVTTAGAWGSVGDRIIETRWYDVNPTPPTLVSTLYWNENTRAAVTGVTSSNTIPCPSEDVTALPISNSVGLTGQGAGTVGWTLIASDAVEAASTTTVLNLTAHVARVGDAIFSQTGTAANQKVWAVVSAVTPNTVTLATPLPSTPTVADQVLIMRPVLIAASGAPSGQSGTALMVNIDAGYQNSAGQGILKLESSASANGDALVGIAGVVNTTNTTLATNGQYTHVALTQYGSTLGCLDWNYQQTTASGLLKREDDPHTTGDAGAAVWAVSNRPLANFSNNDNDYTPIAVGTNGAVYGVLEITAQGNNGLSLLKPSSTGTYTSGDACVGMLGVTNEVQAARNATADRYVPLSMDRYGSVMSSPVSFGATAGSLLLCPVRAEDSAIADGQALMLAGAVNNRSVAAFNSTQGDATPVGVGDFGNPLCTIFLDNNIPSSRTPVVQEDSAALSGDAGMSILAKRRNVPSDDVSANNDYDHLGTSNEGALWVNATSPNATGTLGAVYSAISLATTNAVSISATPRVLTSIYAANTTAAYKYLKLYNKASAPTVGTDVPVMRIPIPPNGIANIHDIYGWPAFSTGLASAITGGSADTDTTAVAVGDVTVNIRYR